MTGNEGTHDNFLYEIVLYISLRITTHRIYKYYDIKYIIYQYNN